MSFFESVNNFFTAIWEFITNVIEGLIIAFQVLQSSVMFSLTLSGFVFGFLGSCIIAVIAVAVVKLIVGWGNS